MLEASAARKADGSFTVLDWIGVLVTVAGVGWLGAWPFQGAPALRRMLHDLGGAVPTVTALALSRPFVLSIAALSLGLVAVGLACGALPRRRLLVVAGFAITLAGAVLLHLAYWLPVLNLAASIK